MASDRGDDTTDTPDAAGSTEDSTERVAGADSPRRRRLLGLLGTAGAAALAGCGGGGGGDGASGTTTSGGGGGGGGGTTAGGGGTSGGTATPSGPTTSVSARALSNLPSGRCEQTTPESQRTLESSRIQSDTTLGSEADVVIASRGLRVTSGTTLTVEAGTTVVFGRGAGLTVGGTLEAVGTCSDPVAFTGDGEDWRGVSVGANASATLDHVLVEGAGGDRRAAVTVQRDGALDLTNTEVRDGPGDAVRVRFEGELGSFSGNALSGTDGRAFVGPLAAAAALDEATTYGSASESPVAVGASTVESGATVELGPLGVPYTVAPAGGGGIGVDGRLVVAPGTTLRFGSAGHVTVRNRGELVADAGGGDPIRFLGLQEVRGAWNGIRFRDATSTANVLRNAVVAHAGADDGQGLSLRSESRVTVADNEFRANEGYGVRFFERATSDAFDGNAFVDNAGSIWTSAQTARHVGGDNEFDGNDDDRVHVLADEFDGHAVPEGEDHTWSNPGVPLFLEQGRSGTFGVFGSLTLESGLTLQMDQNQGIYVTGEMATAVATEDLSDEYTLTSPGEGVVTFEGDQATAGYWKGIAYDGTQSEDNRLRYCTVRHAGGGRLPAATEQQEAAVMVLRGARLQFQDVFVEGSAGYGLFAQRDNDIGRVDRLAFHDCTAPMYLYADSVSSVGRNVLTESNETDQMFLETPVGQTDREMFFENPGIPFRILPSQVGTTLEIGDRMVVKDGAELRFEQDVGVVVTADGSLEVRGESEQVTDPDTVFRGVQAQPGYWQGIRYSETVSRYNTVEGAGIYHTGSAAWPNLAETETTRAAVAATGAAEASVENCHIAEFEGVAFAEAFTSNPLREDSVNATINTAGNVVE